MTMDDRARLASVKRMALAFQRHDWEQGVVAQAFLEAGDEDVALSMSVAAAARQTGDGRCSQLGLTPAITDPCAIGEALLFACERTGDAALYDAKERLLAWALRDAPRNGKGIVYHLLGAQEFWVDSMCFRHANDTMLMLVHVYILFAEPEVSCRYVSKRHISTLLTLDENKLYLLSHAGRFCARE